MDMPYVSYHAEKHLKKRKSYISLTDSFDLLNPHDTE